MAEEERKEETRKGKGTDKKTRIQNKTEKATVEYSIWLWVFDIIAPSITDQPVEVHMSSCL